MWSPLPLWSASGRGIKDVYKRQLYPDDIDENALFISGVAQAFRDGEVGVVQLDIFSDEGDSDRFVSVLDFGDELFPAR